MKTLNEQYQSIKEGKGHKGVFLNEAKRQFPNYIRNAATFDEAALILKQRGVINENLVGLSPINKIESKKESFELAFEKFLEEAKDPQIKAKEVKGKTVKPQEEGEKAELKKPSKQVEKDNKHGYDHSDKKNLDNVIYGQMMKGYYTEMKDPKNEDKTMEQIRDIVLKNLEKDPMHYVKDGQFGVKGVGYVTEHPGLGTPKEATGEWKASGYGDLKENLNPESLKESAVRKIIRAIVNEELEEVTKSTLTESVEKDLAGINKEAEHEILQSKLDKIDVLIDKRKSQLGKLDEDEDMKALTDKKKVKELEKDIKKLEAARSKVEKMMHKGKGKATKKEVIDEDNPIDEVEINEAPPSIDIPKLTAAYKELDPLAARVLKTFQDTSKINLEEEDEEESEGGY